MMAVINIIPTVNVDQLTKKSTLCLPRHSPKSPNANALRVRSMKCSDDAPWKRTSKIKTSPSATFGKSQRNSEQKKVAPGPGAYQLNRTTFEKGFVSFKGNKKIRFYTDSPGPCAYEPTVPFPSKKFSFQRSKHHQKIQHKPSPATYNLRQSKNNGLSFPKEERNLTPQKQKILFPGPGQYESSKGFSHKNQFSFTKTKKFFASNHQSEQKEAVPSPAAYQISKSRGAIKSTKFAKAIRAFLQDDKIPGPGSYHIQRSSLLHQGGIIASQKRSFEYDNQVPGPGNYKQVPVNLVKKKEAVVIINRSRDSSPSQKKNIPGPGAYFSEKKPKEKIVGGVIGRQLRNNIKKVIVPNFNATKINFRQEGAPLTAVKPQTSDDSNMRKNHSFQIHKKRMNPTDNGIRQTAQPALTE